MVFNLCILLLPLKQCKKNIETIIRLIKISKKNGAYFPQRRVDGLDELLIKNSWKPIGTILWKGYTWKSENSQDPRFHSANSNNSHQLSKFWVSNTAVGETNRERGSIKGPKQPSKSPRGRAPGTPVWGQTPSPSNIPEEQGRRLPGKLPARAGGRAPAPPHPCQGLMSLERSHFETG